MERREFLRRSLIAAGTLATPLWLTSCSEGARRRTGPTGQSIPEPFASIRDELETKGVGGLNVFLGGAEFVGGGIAQRFTFRIDDEEGSITGAAATFRLADSTKVYPKVPLSFHSFQNSAGQAPTVHSSSAHPEVSGFYRGLADVPKGRFVDLVVEATHKGRSRFGFAAFEAKPSSQVPQKGSSGVSVPTPTPADLRGVKNLCTSDPVCPMHSESLDTVMGTKPIVLLIGSPKLCSSGVCGPVVDEVLSLVSSNPAVQFLHAEPFATDTPTELSPVAKAFRIDTEPWTFVIGADGMVRQAFEGPVSADELTKVLAGI